MKIKSIFRKNLRNGLMVIALSTGLFSCKKAEIRDNIINSFSRFGANTTISKVIAGNSNTANPVFWAYVTASGASQNASTMLWLQDETAGIAIKLQQDRSDQFTPGTLVLVRTNELKVQREGNFYLLGLPNGDGINALSESELAEYVSVAATEQTMAINQITLAELDASYNQRVVTINDIEVADQNLTGNFGSVTEQEKEIILQDCSGNEITLVTSKDAEVAPIAIKTGHGNLTGLVTFNNGVKQIRLLSAAAADVLKGARCEFLLYAEHKYFVTTNGNATNDGKSWATAKSLEAAIATAVSGDSIFVAAGTYSATSGSPLISLTGANDGIKLYGGFAGTESRLIQRNHTANITILQGNGNRVIYNNGSAAVPITSATVYDGFTITNGFATGSSVGGGMANLYASVTVANCIFKGNATNNGSGGGMYNSQNSVTITNCTFSENTAAANGGGGLIISTGSSANITNCVFDKNTATGGSGGGISTYTDAANPTTVTITNCTFSDNTSANGGGIYNYSNITLTISGCTFTNNTASTNGGSIYNYTSATPTISGCTFTGNVATSNGGGMYNNSSSTPTITNCTFSSNKAATGAGMYNNTSSAPVIANCTFTENNTTANGGGAMYNFTSTSPTVINCVFVGNVTPAGGCVLNNTSSTGTFVNCLFSGNKASTGGAMHNAGGATPTLKNCTIASNNATSNGGGLYSTGAGTVPTVTNCIIYGNSNGIVNMSSASATVTYSNIQYTGGSETNYSSGTGNINVNPLFVSAPAYSTAPFTGGNYTLQNGSLSINAGNNSSINGYTIDLAGNTRIYNNTVDMGAYERQN